MLINSVKGALLVQGNAERPARASEAGQRASPPPDDAAVRRAADAANTVLRAAASTVEFTVAQDTGKTIVRVIDQLTQEVIRQIPSEEMIDIAKAIDRMQGLLVRARV